MRTCDYCGATVEDDEEYCIYCGRKLRKPEPKKDKNKYIIVAVAAACLTVIALLTANQSLDWKSILPAPAAPAQEQEAEEVIDESTELSEEEEASPSYMGVDPAEEEASTGEQTDLEGELFTGEDDSGEEEITEADPVIEWSDSNLRDAVYRKNEIDGELTIEKAQGIHDLDLADANISNIESLKYFTGLQTLTLKNNYITDISALSNLTMLEDLNIEMNSLQDITPLAGLWKLKRLDLHDNNIDDISSLEGLNKLRMLDIRENGVTDISVISDMTMMEELYLT